MFNCLNLVRIELVGACCTSALDFACSAAVLANFETLMIHVGALKACYSIDMSRSVGLFERI